ncbi:class I adenylate-forming enzyme family protein [Frankia sp. R82]|uniref:class I adenylate-forming enzyme family protein n=1 Tax=Frankia sp. R82 TaxID=2950553 RepID=UPI00204432AA|nr:class I adenylate-forming enzyme family protein [Frankia sp. R82]MCM3882291.1 acyl--CoA ligase [Frankia sp. R82]
MIKHSVIAEHALARPGEPAVISGDRTVSWAELKDLTERLATGLAQLLPIPTRFPGPLRATFLSENRWEIAVLQAATATLGLSMVGIDDSLPPAHVAACLRQLQPTVIFVSPSRHALLTKALRIDGPGATLRHSATVVTLPALDGDDPRDDLSWPWDELAAVKPDPSIWPALPFEGLGFTSGTTSAPKLVLRSQPFDARRQRDVIKFFGLTDADVYLNTVPLYHASGAGWARIFMTLGGRVVLAPHDDAPRIVDALVRQRVTGTLMVPPVLDSVVRQVADSVAGPDLTLRFVVTGGRHTSPSLVRRTTAALGDVLHVYYGTTETGLNTLTVAGELRAEPGSVGAPFPGNEILVLDRDDRPLQPRQHGRIAVGGYMIADTYAELPPPRVRVDGIDAWLTPDTGWLDADGRLNVMSRDLPPELAEIDVVGLEGDLRDLLHLDDVAICVDSSEAGPNIVVAFVRSPGSNPTSAQVAAEVVSRVDHVPVHAYSVDRIPYSPTGKVRARTLLSLVGHPSPAVSMRR